MPALNRMLLGVAVAANSCTPSRPICMPLSGQAAWLAPSPRRQTLLGTGFAPRQVIRRRPSNSIAMLAHMNAAASAMIRLAESLALFHIRDDVVSTA